jgi:hypothetical protein
MLSCCSHQIYIPFRFSLSLLYSFISLLFHLHFLSGLFSSIFPKWSLPSFESYHITLISLQFLRVSHVRCSSLSVPSNPLSSSDENFLLYYLMVRYILYTLCHPLHSFRSLLYHFLTLVTPLDLSILCYTPRVISHLLYSNSSDHLSLLSSPSFSLRSFYSPRGPLHSIPSLKGSCLYRSLFVAPHIC